MSEKRGRQAELLLLCGKVRDESCDAEDAARLDALLRSDGDAAAMFVRYMTVASLLESRGVSQRRAADADDDSDGLGHDVFAELLELEARAETIVAEEPRRLRLRDAGDDRPWQVAGAMRWVMSRPTTWGALAAVLAIGVALGFALRGGGEADSSERIVSGPMAMTLPASSEPVAVMTGEHEARWAYGRGTSLGAELEAGRSLTLTRGFAEITTRRGAIAILEAPATFELLDDDNAIRLHAGKLVGLCETDSSKGFIVKTPHMDIIDIGTEFGVEVAGNQLTATVITGEIELARPKTEPQRLTHNQTARFATDGDQQTITIEDQLAQGFTARMPAQALVTSATINDERFSLEIAPQGVYEDALIYSDRDYQMNGLDADGLPAVLRKGDLIRMPADARTGRTIDIGQVLVEVDLSEPCDIYLIAAPNHAALAWVKRDFEPTPMRVGLDVSESFEREQAPVGLGVGPGQSIDETYHVWKRKQPATGRVTFGPAHDQSMYSIVAVPLKETTPSRR